MAFRMAWPQWHYAKLNEPEKHKHMVARSSTYFMAFNGILLVLVGFYLPLVIHVLLNQKFWSVGPTTFVLTLSVALYNLYFIFWIGANVAKKNRLIPVITLVASAVNVGLNFLLVPEYGMWAAAWTTTIGFGILAVLVYFVSNKWYPIPYEWRRLLIILGATVLTLGAGWAIGWAAGVSVSEPLTDLILGSLAMTPALLLFPLVLWAGGFFTPGEQDRLRAAARRLAGRRGQTAGAKSEETPAGRQPAADAAPETAALAGGAAGMAGAAAESLSDDDLKAEEEETEIEAEVDIVEGGSTQI
jgi:peptidoglycan biosynthesis protein MviN/MurJ (putative lipid II flippase)